MKILLDLTINDEQSDTTCILTMNRKGFTT